MTKKGLPPLAKPTITLPAGARGGREHFISHLANKHQWTLGCELGVWKGRTFLHLLKSCPSLTVIGVDLWEAQPDNSGPQNYTEAHWTHNKFEQKVRSQSTVYGDRAIIHKMYTTEATDLVEDGSLDFVFIDADHSEKAVREDIINWSPKVKDDGYIIGHDINWPTVCTIVEELVPGYDIGPDNVWFRKKNP